MNRPHVIEVDVVSPLLIVKTPNFDYRGDIHHFDVHISIDDYILCYFEYYIKDGRVWIKVSLSSDIPILVLYALIGYDSDCGVDFETYIINTFFDM